ncbi:MAG: hypothetical protein E7675_02205 [Ruminococcaceae bacterium]|nr:hypothetical protein [Oscillospiraceae bacterium]
MKEIINSDIKKIAKGLSIHSEALKKLDTIRSRYLYEIAELVCEAIEEPLDITEELPSSYKKAVKENIRGLSREEKAKIASYIAGILGEKYRKMNFESFGIPQSPKPTTINYVKNVYSDRAYRGFDEHIGGLYSEYADSFLSAAQAVYYENSSGCILPYCAHDGTVMTGIAKLIETYDLKKSAVFTTDTGGVQHSEFALFTHGIWANRNSDILEFTVRSDDPFFVEDIIAACRMFNYESIFHSRRTSLCDGEKYDFFTAKSTDPRCHISMLFFLSTEFERYNITGLYKSISE